MTLWVFLSFTLLVSFVVTGNLLHMAKQKVTGLTEEEVEELHEEFLDLPASEWYEFEERYCLWMIPYQPEDYDGPDRYCPNTAQSKKGGWHRCHYHKNRGAKMTENMTPGNPKHFMYASEEYLLNHLTEEELELYERILGWAEIYGIDKDEDPAAWDDLCILAKQRVREVKASKYIFEEGEIREKMVRDEEGNVVLDDDGNPVTEDDTNTISEEYRRLIGLIQSLKKQLIISRKERSKAEDRNIVADSAEMSSKAFSELVSDDEKNFNVNEYEN